MTNMKDKKMRPRWNLSHRWWW